MAIDKWKNNKLNLVARVQTLADDLEGYVEAASFERLALGKGKVYVYVKTDRGSVNNIYERKAYQANYLKVLEVLDKKLKRTYAHLLQ